MVDPRRLQTVVGRQDIPERSEAELVYIYIYITVIAKTYATT